MYQNINFAQFPRVLLKLFSVVQYFSSCIQVFVLAVSLSLVYTGVCDAVVMEPPNMHPTVNQIQVNIQVETGL